MRFRKIFGLGLSKTGTTTLTRALNELDIPCIHFPSDPVTLRQIDRGDLKLDILERYDAVTDIVLVPFYDELDRIYPDSGFILSVRDVEDWLGSVERQWASATQGVPPDIRNPIRHRVYGCHDFNREHYRFVFERHRRTVEAYFEGRPGKLLVVDICAGDGWEKLCPFLDVPIPDFAFPRANAGISRERVQDSLRVGATPDEKITWSLQTYQDYDRLIRCLKRLRAAYPKSPIQIVSDGDPDPKYSDARDRFNVKFTSGEHLHVVERGGEAAQRLLDLFLKAPTEYLIKIDPDTHVAGRLDQLPGPSTLGVFGSVWESAGGLRSIQGGCMIIPRATAETIRDSGLLLSERLKPPELAWVWGRDARERVLKLGRSSHEWTIAWAARELEIPMISHPQVCSGRSSPPLRGLRGASIVHPCPNALAYAFLKSIIERVTGKVQQQSARPLRV